MKIQFQDRELKVLEAGAGAGGLARELLIALNGLSVNQLYVTDIADGMLDKSRERLEGLDKAIIEKADYTKFQYDDGTFDRYYANMCLHYAQDPDIVIEEAYRVLSPGGIAGFTVWGRSAHSELFTIVPDTLNDLGLVMKDPNKRSSFHLGEDDLVLRQKLLDHGFKKCTLMHYPGVIECFDPSYFVEIIIDGAASTKEQIESFSQEEQVRVREAVLKRGKEILDKGKPLMLDMTIVVAMK